MKIYLFYNNITIVLITILQTTVTKLLKWYRFNEIQLNQLSLILLFIAIND